MRAIMIDHVGGPEVLQMVDMVEPPLQPHEIRIEHAAIGLNFIDIYQRSGLYPMALPARLGLEAAGVVVETGRDVSRFKLGDRVAYCSTPGAYAERNSVPEALAVAIPADVSFEIAAAAMLKGLTAEFLCRRIWPLAPGDRVLVHAAAGGVGGMLTQWLNHLGITVIGVVGSAAKAQIAERQGCHHVLLSDGDDIAARVQQITGGEGVKVVYDSVGAATFDASLASLARRGLFVSFGNASGPAPAFEPGRLMRGGSLFLTRPTLFDYLRAPGELDSAAADLFDVIKSGAVKIDIGQSFALADIAKAHTALASRQTTGATVIRP